MCACVCVCVSVCVCVQRSGVWQGVGIAQFRGWGGNWTHLQVNPVALGKCSPSLGFTLAIRKVITGFASSFT